MVTSKCSFGKWVLPMGSSANGQASVPENLVPSVVSFHLVRENFNWTGITEDSCIADRDGKMGSMMARWDGNAAELRPIRRSFSG